MTGSWDDYLGRHFNDDAQEWHPIGGSPTDRISIHHIEDDLDAHDRRIATRNFIDNMQRVLSIEDPF